MTYTLVYRQPYLTSALFTSASFVDHTATITVKNEPFSDATC